MGEHDRYDALMDVVAGRITTRAFQPDYVVPREHFELIVDAARHGPSGANAQPWHFIVVTDAARQATDRRVLRGRAGAPRAAGNEVPNAQLSRARHRAGARSSLQRTFVSSEPSRCCAPRIPTRRSTVRTTRTPSGSCFRVSLPRRCPRTSPRAALGLQRVVGDGDRASATPRRRSSPCWTCPEALSVIDIMCFGPPAKPAYKRWKKDLGQIMSWERLDRPRTS